MWGRRIVSASIAALMASAVLAAPSGAAPDANAWAGHQAMALWVETEDGAPVIYFALALQGGSAEPSQAAVVRSVCIRRGDAYRCPLRIDPEPIGPTDLMIDPMMEQATLNADLGGVQHSIVWAAADEDSMTYEFLHAGGSGVSLTTGTIRDTDASASLFGRSIKANGWADYSYIGRGAAVSAWADGGARRFDLEVGRSVLRVVLL